MISAIFGTKDLSAVAEILFHNFEKIPFFECCKSIYKITNYISIGKEPTLLEGEMLLFPLVELGLIKASREVLVTNFCLYIYKS